MCHKDLKIGSSIKCLSMEGVLLQFYFANFSNSDIFRLRTYKKYLNLFNKRFKKISIIVNVVRQPKRSNPPSPSTVLVKES